MKNKQSQKSTIVSDSVEKMLFLSKKMLLSFQKDVLPAHKRSNIVYKYSCQCDSLYVGTAIPNDWKNKFNNMF